MAGMDHPNIVRLVEAFYSSTHVHLIMELCQGGELYDHLADQQHYSEESASQIIRKLLLACRYLHDHNVVHRDLKVSEPTLDLIPSCSHALVPSCPRAPRPPHATPA